MQTVIVLLAAAFGSFGFALLYGLRLRYALPAALFGCVGWGVYLGASALGAGEFAAVLVAAAVVSLIAEIAARLFKAPAPLFLLPSVIPLVPGRALYYTMSSLVRRDFAAAEAYGYATVQTALAIATGTGLVFAMLYMVMQIKKHHAARKHVS